LFLPTFNVIIFTFGSFMSMISVGCANCITLVAGVQPHQMFKLFQSPGAKCDAIFRSDEAGNEVDPYEVQCDSTTYSETLEQLQSIILYILYVIIVVSKME
jgi:hypothetical protein